MNLDDFKPFEGEALVSRLKNLSRDALDEYLHHFGGQYSLLCQRLEAVYSPDRIDRFIAIRPGSLPEIDEALRQAETAGAQKEITLLKSFRELNRVLLPFMDIYEAQVLTDLQYMSREELQTLSANLARDLQEARQQQTADPTNYRAVQNAEGTLRLAGLMQEAVQKQLQDRYGSTAE